MATCLCEGGYFYYVMSTQMLHFQGQNMRNGAHPLTAAECPISANTILQYSKRDCGISTVFLNISYFPALLLGK